jgi:hypothetical protein
MSSRTGFRMSMFDPRNAVAANVNNKDGIVINDQKLFAVEEERRISSDMKVIERKLNTKTMEQGFSIEVKNGQSKTGITSPTDNPYLAHLWETEIAKANLHRTDFGFAAVQIREIRNPDAKIVDASKIVDEKTLRELEEEDELDDSSEAQEEVGRERDLIQEEIDALEKQRPTKPESILDPDVQSYRVPRVMDPINEYLVKIFTLPDGSRHFLAFPRGTVGDANAKPIPNSRVYIFFEPDAQGNPDSPFISCLEDLQQLRTYRERHEVRDWRGTNPPIFYAESPKGESIIPNTTVMPTVEAPQDPTHIPAPERSGYGSTAPLARVMAKDSLERREAQLNYGTRWIRQAVEGAVAGSFPKGATVEEVHFHSQLNRLTHLGAIDQFGPYIPLPEHVTISSNAPQPKQAESFEFTITQLMARIANVTGVQPEMLTGERAKVGAEVGVRQDENDSVIRAIQRQLERFVAQVYIDIFAPLQKQRIEYSIKETRYRLRMEALLMYKEQREEMRRQLEAKIDQVDAVIDETGEENNRVAIERKRTQLIKALSTFEEPDEGVHIEQATQQMALLDRQFEEYNQIRLEKETQVVVRFHENPTLSPEKILQLEQMGAISKENSRKMMLKYFGLPEEILATDAEREADFKVEAKHQAVLDEQKQAMKPTPASGSSKPKPAPKKE